MERIRPRTRERQGLCTALSLVGWLSKAGGLYQTRDGGSSWQEVGAYGAPTMRDGV